MAENATTGESETHPSVDASSETASLGGDPTHSGPSAPPSWTDPEYQRKRLDGTFRKGYGEGRNKGFDEGRNEGRNQLVDELGFDSFESMRDAFTSLGQQSASTQVQQQQPAQVPAAQPQDEEEHGKLIRKIRTERSELKKQNEELESQVQRFQMQAERAMDVDLKAKLLHLGALPDAADDLIYRLKTNVKWSDDGSELVIVGKREDGSIGPTFETVDEFLTRQRETKPWFFRPTNKAGSGSNPDIPAVVEAPQQDDFRGRLNKYHQRGS